MAELELGLPRRSLARRLVDQREFVLVVILLATVGGVAIGAPESMTLDNLYAVLLALSFQAIVEAASSFVGRLHENAVLEVLEERPLTPEAVKAGVLSDRVGRLGCKSTKDDLQVPVRVIEVACTPHRKPSGKTARGGPEQGDRLRLVTDRMDLAADLVGLIYQARWQIETFFRTFKHVLGCRRLVSYSQNGIALQTYAAILACLLIALWTGRKPTLRTYEMLCYYFTGWADAEELEAHIAKLQEQPSHA
jgi:hypothetical protein